MKFHRLPPTPVACDDDEPPTDDDETTAEDEDTLSEEDDIGVFEEELPAETCSDEEDPSELEDGAIPPDDDSALYATPSGSKGLSRKAVSSHATKSVNANAANHHTPEIFNFAVMLSA